jgi:hypothetical protein
MGRGRVFSMTTISGKCAASGTADAKLGSGLRVNMALSANPSHARIKLLIAQRPHPASLLPYPPGWRMRRMLHKTSFPIGRIRVPVKRAKTLDGAKVTALAESILEEGQLTPIRVRADGENFVLIEGLHRLEALKALGEETVEGYLVNARLH